MLNVIRTRTNYGDQQNYDLEWEEDPGIREVTALSAYFNGGPSNGNDDPRHDKNLYFNHPKVKIIGSEDVATTITQIGDGGFFNFNTMKSVEIKNLRFVNKRKYFTEGILTSATITEHDEKCTENIKPCVTKGLTHTSCIITEEVLKAQMDVYDFKMVFIKELCRRDAKTEENLPATTEEYDSCVTATKERYDSIKTAATKTAEIIEPIEIQARQWISQKRCLNKGAKIEIKIEAHVVKDVSQNEQLTAIWGTEKDDNGQYEVTVGEITIGEDIEVGEAYSFFGRINKDIALLHDSYGQRFVSKENDNGYSTKVSMPALSFSKVENVTLQNIWLHSAAGMAIYIKDDPTVDGKTSKIKLQNVNLIPDNLSKSSLSVNSDSVNIGAWKGKVEIKDSKFIGGGDDGLNVRSNYKEITFIKETKDGYYTIQIASGKHSDFKVSTYIPERWVAAEDLGNNNGGTKLVLINRETMIPYGYAEIIRWENVQEKKKCDGPCSIIIKIHYFLKSNEKRLQKTVLLGDLLDVVATKPEVTITNTVYKHLRARGLNVKTKSLTVKNCKFENLLGPAIQVSQDSCHDMESGVSSISKDGENSIAVVDLQNNFIKDCNLLPMLSMTLSEPRLGEDKYFPMIAVSSRTERDSLCYREQEENACYNKKYEETRNKEYFFNAKGKALISKHPIYVNKEDCKRAATKAKKSLSGQNDEAAPPGLSLHKTPMENTIRLNNRIASLEEQVFGVNNHDLIQKQLTRGKEPFSNNVFKL
eukprot:g12753.t1